MCLIVISYTLNVCDWLLQMYDDVGIEFPFLYTILMKCFMLQEGEKHTHTHLVNNV